METQKALCNIFVSLFILFVQISAEWEIELLSHSEYFLYPIYSTIWLMHFSTSMCLYLSQRGCQIRDAFKKYYIITELLKLLSKEKVGLQESTPFYLQSIKKILFQIYQFSPQRVCERDIFIHSAILSCFPHLT